MKSGLIVTIGNLFLSVSAVPTALTAPPGHEFIAPRPNDSRSPCPGLNSLANHGFLPRNGKNIKPADYVDACLAGLKVGPSFCLPIGIAALQSNCSSATQMDLNQLQRHDVLIEHDGSLSRQDIFFGPDYPVNSRSYDMFIEGFHGAMQTSIKSASATKYGRVNDSIHNNPEVTYGARELAFSYTETALYLQTMGRSLTSGVAPLDYVKTFFGQERLPYELGWTKGPEVTLESLGAMDVVLQSNAPAPGDELIYTLTAGSIAELFEVGTILSAVTHPKACS